MFLGLLGGLFLKENLQQATTSYQKQRRPASEFKSRNEYLEHELKIMDPQRWRPNLPKRDFNFEPEDFICALAGMIGITVMVTATVTAYATGYGLPADFILANVRFELLLVSLLFVLPICGFLNPRVNLPGNHGPMIPLVGLIVVAGGHPLALGIMIGVLGLILSLMKGGSRLIELTGTGVRSGLLIFIGLMGLTTQLTALRTWAASLEMELVFLIVVFVSIIIYSYLANIEKLLLAIPVCSILAATVAYSMGAPLQFVTEPGVPNLNPFYWWGTDSGWLLGLPTLEHFIAVTPFALLAIAMWPPDFLGHRIFQELNYPKEATKVLMDVDDTMTICSVRQMVGSVLGGGNIASSWGTYIIPAGLAKRPIPAGAVLTGVGCIIAALLGFPMDLLTWPPVLHIALIIGVFLPLLKAGLKMIKNVDHVQKATLCIFGSAFINPVFGWALTMLLDNAGLLGTTERIKSMSNTDRYVIPLITFLVCAGVMAIVGKIPGVLGMI